MTEKEKARAKKNFDWTKLRTTRLEVLKLSQENVARLINCPTSTYRNWEKGVTSPSLSYYFKLKELFKF